MTTAIRDTHFSVSGNYYDLFYKSKNYAAEAEQVVSVIKSYNPAAYSMLEVGCGTGNHAQHFTKLGFEVLGLDQSVAMLTKATHKAMPGFRAVIADACDFHLGECFDAAVSLFHVISYLTSNEAVLSCLRHVHEHLKEDGIFIFDTWYSPAVWVQGAHERKKTCIHEDESITRTAIPTIHAHGSLVNVQYQYEIQNVKTGVVRSFSEDHLMRHFSIPEVQLLAQMTGFELVHTTNLDGTDAPGADTWSVCFTLQKNK